MVEIVFTVEKIIVMLSILILAVIANYYYTIRTHYGDYVSSSHTYDYPISYNKMLRVRRYHIVGYMIIVIYHIALFMLLAN